MCTCDSQSRVGRAAAEVMISTVSELRSGRDSGAMRPFTRAPAQCCPISVCTANAKSIGVAPFGQLDDVAGGREHEDLVLIQIEFEELQELVGRLRVELEFQDLAEPGEVPVEFVGALAPPCTASARRCRSRRPVHVARADLHLVQLPARPEHRRVQRLVSVRLGLRDVVLIRSWTGVHPSRSPGRPKHLWSIYKKMPQRQKPYEEIYDLLAIRVLVNTVPECYHALGVIHDGWTPRAGTHQGLHRAAQVERLPVAAHDGVRAGPAALRDPDPHARHAPHGRLRHRGALAVQGGREERRRPRPPPHLVPPDPRPPARREDARRVPRVPQARPVPGRDLRVHAHRAT